jgi:hypothetical protein
MAQEYDKSYAIYPKRFYAKVAALGSLKVLHYCFVGTLQIDAKTKENRRWIIDFAKKHFDDNSYLQLTDAATRSTHIPLGRFDHTLTKKGLVPKETPLSLRNRFDENYFRVMRQSKFCLCPAGDANWSMRFYEALMCRSIPIVANKVDTYRSEHESKLRYRYFLADDEHVYNRDWAEENYQLFLKYHTFEHGLPKAFR